jgi:hypothetical protein
MSRRAFFTISAMLLSILSMAPPVGAADRRIETAVDSDYAGFDLRTVKNVTQAQCETTCIGDNACRAFTYNVKAKWCFLKSDYSQLNPFVGAVAGKVVETAAAPDIGAPEKLSFLSEDLLQQARDEKAGLALGENQQGYGLANLKAIAQGELVAGRFDTAIYNYKGALAVAPEDAALWIELARAAGTAPKDNSTFTTEAVTAAINGYQASRLCARRVTGRR